MVTKRTATAETEEDKKSKRNLLSFLKVNQRALQQVFDSLGERLRAKADSTIQHLDTLRKGAFEGQRGIQEFFEKGINMTQRGVLLKLGLWHDDLLAKLQLLWDCVRDGTLSPILKALNSILGSLSKVFAPLHAVKEFKEMMEVAIDRLGPESDPIVLNLGGLPVLE